MKLFQIITVSIYRSAEYHNPDVLLLDEVFWSGGDSEFQRKAVKKVVELVKGGTTVLLVSHNMDLIRKYCKKVIWMDKGNIVKQGKTREVLKYYLKSQTK